MTMPQPAFTTRPEIQGQFGAVTSTHWLASAAGMAVLEKGGNAFDAACAAGFVLQVAEPHLNGPGGEVPVLFWSEREQNTRVLCAQGHAPARASIAAFQDLGLDTIPGSGFLPAVVPGAFGGWLTLLRDYGTLPLEDVLSYAIHYAETGVPVLPKIADFISRVEVLFNEHWPTSAAVYLDGGAAPAEGSWLTNTSLANTYRRLVSDAKATTGKREAQIDAALDAWYRGWVAETVGKFYAGEPLLDASGRAHRGFLSAEDFAAWSPTYEDPVTYDFGRYRVAKCGFWSQGPVMLQQLAMLEAAGLREGGRDLDPEGPEFVHLVTEVAKLCLADREAWYGDPAFVDVPADTLLSQDYAQARMSLVGETASLDLRAGSPDGRPPNLDAALSASGDTGDIGHYWSLGEPTVSPLGVSRGDTCHIDVVDRFGNMVAATPSGGWLQSAPVVPELGFCMSVRGQMFWLDPNSPSALAPGRRPRTTLSPSLALRDGKPYLAWGTPGGDQQDQWSTLLFLQHVVFGRNLQAAIDAPAFHTDHAPSSFWPRGRQPGRLAIESRFPEATLEALGARGHHVAVGGPWSEGRLCAAAREGDIIRAAANPRGMQGYAIGR